jgi:hypothetical protein
MQQTSILLCHIGTVKNKITDMDIGASLAHSYVPKQVR